MTTSLARVKIRYEQDVVHARQRARLIAEQLGFDRQDQTRISTAVSEIARNAHQYGQGGEVEFMLEATAPPPRFIIAVRDHGPGIADLDAILEGRYTSRTGMGLGIVGSRMLLGHLHIDTRSDQGTTVTLDKLLPLNAPAVTPVVLRRIADALADDNSASPMEEIRAQNQELVVEITERNRITALLLDQSKLLQQEVVERRSAQQELEALNGELEERVTAGVEKVREKDQALMQNEKLASLGHLAAGVAHEINNPMGYITSNLSVLADYFDQIVTYCRSGEENDPNTSGPSMGASGKMSREMDAILVDGVDLIRESLEGTERIMEIVQNLKNFSRTDSLKGAMVALTSCLESALIIAHNELKYVATIRKEYESTEEVFCHPGQLCQVFLNLLVNAGQAIISETLGEIVLRSWHDALFAYVSVSDTGGGIPEVIRERVFDPFFTTKEVGKGTGLGLSISSEIMKKHRGELMVESVVGVGTTFTVKLPFQTRETSCGN